VSRPRKSSHQNDEPILSSETLLTLDPCQTSTSSCSPSSIATRSWWDSTFDIANPDVGTDSFARLFLGSAFDGLRFGLPAYVRATTRHLVWCVFESLDPQSVVLLVPASLGETPQLIEALARLSRTGVTLGIDDYPPGDTEVYFGRLAGISARRSPE
jgi:hypothetical protein